MQAHTKSIYAKDWQLCLFLIAFQTLCLMSNDILQGGVGKNGSNTAAAATLLTFAVRHSPENILCPGLFG